MLKNKKLYWYLPVLMFIMATDTVFIFWDKTGTREELHAELIVEEPLHTMVQQENIIEEHQSIITTEKNSFIGFKEKMGYRESRGNYFITNDYGYMGKYQFGKSALKFYGVSSEDFLNSPELQEKVFQVSLSHNKWRLQREINLFAGKKIAGVLVTESGILAAAHLAGVGNVKSYLNSGGQNGFADANGTSIRNYMRSFQDYDLSIIKPNAFDRTKVTIKV
ncbi:MAG: peptidoglycan-binding protein LysM [Capnocytophaga sp.]|nr:peptidoglycan-binding protein LysM [Capnocytophaga sp.]